MKNKPETPIIKSFELELLEGFADEKGTKHTKVEIGNLTKAGEYFLFESIWEDFSETALNAFLLSRAITKFGTLKTPVSESFLLNLLSTDLEDLGNALNEFTAQNGTPQLYAQNTIKLIYGIEKDGVVYDLVEFGAHTKGFDEVQKERLNLSGNRGMAFLAGKEIVKLYQSEGEKSLNTGLDLEAFSQMYLIDVIGILEQSKIWNELTYLERKIEAARKTQTKVENN